MYNQRTWVLTDLGAVNFFTLQQVAKQQQAMLNQQQATISLLCAEVSKLKQLSSPKQKVALPSAR